MEVFDTIHVMAWSASLCTDVPGSARWDIYRYEDTPIVSPRPPSAVLLRLTRSTLWPQLRDWLYDWSAPQYHKGITTAKFRESHDDALFNETLFLDASARLQLHLDTGLRPFTVWQAPGEHVVVPAGCAFQITTFDDCLSYAHDFLSPEHLHTSVEGQSRLLPSH